MNKKEFMKKMTLYPQILIKVEHNCEVIAMRVDMNDIFFKDTEKGNVFAYNIDTLFDKYQSGEFKFID